MIKFILAEGAKLPVRGSTFAAGLDIHAMDDIVLNAGERRLISTGVKLADCPLEIYLRVAPRSKLANKYGLDVLAGVVDTDYRGEIMVILHNTSASGYQITAGEAIAQLIAERITYPKAVEVIEGTATGRGSSGINCKEAR